MRRIILSVCTLFMILISLALPGSLAAQTWGFRAGFGTTESGSDRGNAMVTDAAGNVYVVGNYTGAINFGTGNLPLANANEGFVAKFNAAGVCQWAFGLGDDGNDATTAIATDGVSVYIGGNFLTSLTIAPLATVNSPGGIVGYIAKLNASNGAGQWISTIANGGTENVWDLALDPSGNVYAAGTFFGSTTFGSFTRTPNGGSSTDLYVAQLNPSSGAFNWVSTGGALSNTDCPGGANITYVAALNEIVLTGSYNGATATYATVAPAVPSSVSITNAGSLDICFLEINATNGAFINAIGVGSTGIEEGPACVYDPFTQDVIAAGYFISPSIAFPGNSPLTNEGNNDAWYARFNPATDVFVWSKAAGGSAGSDRAFGITTNGTGAIYVVGIFRGTLDLPTTLTLSPITNNRTADDIFLARISATDGNGQLLAQGAGETGNTISNAGNAVAAGPGNAIWVTGSYGNNTVFAPLAPLPTSGSSTTTADMLLAKYNDPTPPVANPSQTPANCTVGCNGTATVNPTGGVAPYTYTWTPNISTSNTATGLCPGATVSVLITDAIGSTVTQNFTITPASSLASANAFNTSFVVSATNNNIYDASCNLICTVVPIPTSPVSGTVSAKVWFEPGVPVYPPVTGEPYVARHYEIMPASGAAGATARITLYFTQAEFNAFNAHPGSQANLPTGPGDGPGIANVRFSKFAGTSNNNTGLPGTYPNNATVIDPVDGDVVWNATLNRWEISFNTTGFSGFFLQTSQAALPVTWLSVNGSLNANGQAVISWKVQEEQVANYAMEKSVDGQAYSTIATLASKGNGENEYLFQETQALAGKASYRIRQTDIDGRSSYSKAIMLRSDRSGWITVYPNPVKQSATLNVTDKELLNTTAVLYDGTGREVQRLRITQSVTTVHLTQQKPGVYTLRFKNGETIRIVKE